MQTIIPTILQFLEFSERLKCELRHSWLSSGRQESVAEHCWQLAFMALLLSPSLELPIKLEKALKMSLVHDLAEAETGDIPYFEKSARQADKAEREQLVMERIRERLPGAIGQEIYDLWQEFETQTTAEAKFVKALDHLEVQFQHNRAALTTWEAIEYELVYTKMDAACQHDRFLQTLCDAIKADAEQKLRAAGIDVNRLKERLHQQG
jgi:putative hydrolases of HD superfamily